MGKVTLQGWLGDRRRSYADGLALFRALAPDDMKARFLAFFSEVNDAPQFDGHYTVLVNKLSFILRMSSLKPQSMAVDVAGKAMRDVVNKARAVARRSDEAAGDKVLKEILVKESLLLALQDKITDLEDDNEDKSDGIAALESDLEEVREDLRELQDRFATLRPGVKIVTYSALPDDVRSMFDRIRYITPLYASLFTEMQAESLTPEEREPIAKQVYDLWTERAELWDRIDAWAEDKRVSLKLDEKRTEELPADQVLEGMRIANRIERLKENIRRTEVSVANHGKSGKENMRQKALRRLDDYKRELAELEKPVR